LPNIPFPPDSSYDEPYPYIVQLARHFGIPKAEIERGAGLLLTRLVGKLLYASLFPEEIAERYLRALEDVPAQHAGQPLQVRLYIPPAFEALPWEALCHTQPEDDRFLALHERLTLVRVPVQQSVKGQRSAKRQRSVKRQAPNEPPETLRVLVVLATQRDDLRFYPIRAAEHKKRLNAILGRLDRVGEAEVSWVQGSETLKKLEDQLRLAERAQKPIHLLHIICHGEVKPDGGVLYFNDEEGHPTPLRLDELRNLWERYPMALAQLRLVVLNACLGARPPFTNPFNSFAAALVRAGVPAVSAMQFAIADEATLHFTNALYSGLIRERLAVDSAMALARRRLFEAYSDSASWIIPALLLHGTVIEPLRLRPLVEPDKPQGEADQPAGVPAFFQARGLDITTPDQVEQIFKLREIGAASTDRSSVQITLEEDGAGPVVRPITTLAAPRSLVVCVPPGCGKTTLRLTVGRAAPAQTLVIHIADLKALDRTTSPEALLRLVLRAALESLAHGLTTAPQRWSALRGDQIATARLWALHQYFRVAFTQLPEALPKSDLGANQHAEYAENGEGYTLQRWLDELWRVARVAGYTRGYQVLVEDEQRDDGRRAAQRDQRLRALLGELHDVAPHEYTYSVKLFVTESVYARLGVGVVDGVVDLPVYRVRWSDRQLAGLLESRLREYSPTVRNQAETSLGPDLFAQSVVRPLPRLAAKAGRSPQEFLRWLRKVVERHCKQAADPQRPIGQETLNKLGL
jgi:hypothetical protein